MLLRETMKLLSTLLVLTFLVGCSDREKIEELEMEKAELQKELRARENELSEAEKIQIELDELQEQLAATGGGEKTVERYDHGQKKSEGYLLDDGTKVGLWTFWYENGQKESEGSYKNWEKEGIWTFWYENGQKRSEGSAKNRKKEGLWTYWHEKGDLDFQYSGIYKTGRKIAPHPDDPNQ
jgi:antitoxin component YwqK of YwqJK toxin-antitoxin module